MKKLYFVMCWIDFKAELVTHRVFDSEAAARAYVGTCHPVLRAFVVQRVDR